MRNALFVEGLIITSDNSAAIGEKPLDEVQVPDALVAKFAARVALSEQWAAGGEVSAIVLHNFSGEQQWSRYIEGIGQLFSELDTPLPPVSGSTESNMATLQSGLAVTMIGRRVREQKDADKLHWFVYGEPLVGEAVLKKTDRIADLRIVKKALDNGWIELIWPVGSRGIAHEAEQLFGKTVALSDGFLGEASAGPATCLLIGVEESKVPEAKRHFGTQFCKLLE
ncbi:alpha-ribazole-5-phosphate synthase [Planococcus sp. ISL-109]|uniref:alpha-ribazole-5-phosphate synthase n=1 Tax=Planococcus sp. ISL-109 TaxID=2819166 RepID=UPI001BE7A33B|nr:alpha-ribazole-5-phosphate synthase [Planococcus sp. ISL-109]MBT2583022.1 alpha-ribazole-5-phosphate synthase [Planococcus sp. ISL-109]